MQNMSIVVGRREERRRRRLKNSPEKVMRVHAEVVHHALEPRFYCLCRIADYANQSSKHMVEGQVGVTAKIDPMKRLCRYTTKLKRSSFGAIPPGQQISFAM